MNKIFAALMLIVLIVTVGCSKKEAGAQFVAVVMPVGAKQNTVYIFAPKNCPSEAAQRALDLSKQLAGMGIPNVLSDSYRAQQPVLKTAEALDAFKADMDKTATVLSGEPPIVFLNGKGQVNPTLDEVVAEFNLHQE